MPRFDATALTRLRRVSQAVPAPDGTWLAVAAARLDPDESKYVSDLWRVPLDGGAAVALTSGPWHDTAPQFRRDGSLVFLSNRPRGGGKDEGGEPRTQVWVLPAIGGEPRPLTDEPLGVIDVRCARDSDRFAILAPVWPDVAHDAQRAHAADRAKHGPTALRFRALPVRHWDRWLDGTATHVIAYDADGSRRDLTPAATIAYRDPIGGWPLAISPDGARVAAVATHVGPDGNDDSVIRVFSTDNGAHRDCGAAPGVNWSEVAFSPDGRWLAGCRVLRAPSRGDAPRLWCFEVGGDPAGAAVAADWDAHVSLAGWTPDGALLATVDLDGRVPVFRVELDGRRTRLTAVTAGGCHQSLAVASPAGSAPQLVGVRHTVLHPPEPFAAPLVADATPRLLAGLSGFTAEDGAAIARWESFVVPGDGGVPVQSFLILPVAAAHPGPRPLLLWPHGGPQAQHVEGWHWRWNTLVAAAAGYAVLLPNPRGSTGAGQAFIDGIMDNSWGGACYRDLLAAVDAAAARPEIDATRLVAMGGSFGGYMVNWIGVQTERFRCIVSHASIFSFPAFHGTTDYPGYFAHEMLGNPYDAEPAHYGRYSPHSFVGRWRTPTLITHGERDYRVPVSEGLLLFEALHSRGVPVELVVFPDEGHWIARPRNARAWYEAWLEFVARHI